MEKIKLFCLPYAGGSTNIYAKWNKYLDNSIEIYPVELAGRGKRYGEPLYENIEQAVEDVYRFIKSDIDEGCEYAVFGHSLGGLIAYELVHKIKQEGKMQPIHIFFSGAKAPHFERDTNKTYNLPEEEFKQKLTELGGTPKEVLEDAALLDVFFPVLRADFKVNETYSYRERQDKIDCNITVIGGKKEDIKLNEIIEWRKHTSGKCSILMLDGDHFFINTHMEDVIKIINSVLASR